MVPSKYIQSIEKGPVDGRMDAHHPLGEGGGLAVDGPLSESRQRVRLFTPIRVGCRNIRNTFVYLFPEVPLLCLSIVTRSDEMKQRPKKKRKSYSKY